MHNGFTADFIITCTELPEVTNPPQLFHLIDHQIEPRHCLDQQRGKGGEWQRLRKLEAGDGYLAQRGAQQRLPVGKLLGLLSGCRCCPLGPPLDQRGRVCLRAGQRGVVPGGSHGQHSVVGVRAGP